MGNRQFDVFCNKLGDKYKNDYFNVCTNNKYNESKALNQNLEPEQYIQASSEQIYFYWLSKKFKNICWDKKLNPPKDVDIYVENSGKYNLSIEVKTPEIKLDMNPNRLELSQNHKYDTLPRDISPSYAAFNFAIDQILNEINSNTSIHNKEAVKGKIDDLKIKDYLESANQKMQEINKDTINILLICLDTNNILKFMNYIINPYTGLLSQDPIVSKEKYENIEYIVLSNCVEAHLDSNFKFNVWDANNYLNFVIYLNKDCNKSMHVHSLFNDKFCDFVSKMDNYAVDGAKIFEVQFSLYIAENYKQFTLNSKERKY